MQLFDSHCHLDDASYQGDLEGVFKRARAAGVLHLMTIGVTLETSRKALDLAKARPGVYASVGVHPHDAQECSERVLQELMDLVCDVFPGSWLPYGKEGMIEPAKEHFKLVHVDSGRLDYIETIDRWTKAFNTFNLEKYGLYATLLPKLFNSDFRKWVRRYRIAPNLQVFEREIFEHYRMVFEKVKD